MTLHSRTFFARCRDILQVDMHFLEVPQTQKKVVIATSNDTHFFKGRLWLVCSKVMSVISPISHCVSIGHGDQVGDCFTKLQRIRLSLQGHEDTIVVNSCEPHVGLQGIRTDIAG